MIINTRNIEIISKCKVLSNAIKIIMVSGREHFVAFLNAQERDKVYGNIIKSIDLNKTIEL